jgi:hypothetical protein
MGLYVDTCCSTCRIESFVWHYECNVHDISYLIFKVHNNWFTTLLYENLGFDLPSLGESKLFTNSFIDFIVYLVFWFHFLQTLMVSSDSVVDVLHKTNLWRCRVHVIGPTFELCVACGMVGCSSLMSIILFLAHSLPIGVVSSNLSCFEEHLTS